jgi:uncharacterized protein (TIRG00374 family)
LPQKRILLLLRLLATIAIFFVLFKLVPYSAIINIYRGSYKIYLLAGYLVFSFSHLIAIFRWRFILLSLGLKISLRETAYAFFSGLFFNLFFPSLIAGDFFRGLSISYRHGEIKKVASSVLMDRFSGAIALALVAFFSLLIGRNIIVEKQIFFAIFILCAIIGIIFLLIFNRRLFLLTTKILKKDSSLRFKLVKFHDELAFFKNNPYVFIKAIIFSFFIQVLLPIGFFIISKAFNLETSVIYFLILVPIIAAIALIPITVAGAGTREASAVYFFSLIGISKDIGLGMSLMNLIFLLFSGIMGGVLYVVIYHRWLQSRS